jgi:hypothetical protein
MASHTGLVNQFPYSLRTHTQLYDQKYVRGGDTREKGKPTLIPPEHLKETRIKDAILKQKIKDKRLTGIRKNYINIDSFYRRQREELVIPTSYTILDPNPLSFTMGSDIITIADTKHGFNIGDHIFLQNVVGDFKRVDSPFEAHNGSNFIRVTIMPTHGLTTAFNMLDELFVEISGVTASVGNFQPNLINGVQQIFLTSNFSTFPDVNNDTDNSSFSFTDHFFYIEMPKKATGFYSDAFSNTNLNVTFKYLFVAGIPLYVINNGFPANLSHLASHQDVFSIVDEDSFTIKVPRKAVVSTFAGAGLGGKLVNIASIDTILPAFPDPNHYVIDLERIFYNVIEVKLVSTEFPNSQPVFRNTTIGLKNNKLYWSDIDDVTSVVYILSLPPGTYSPTELKIALEKQFSLIPRESADPSLATEFHNFTVDIDLSTNIVSFSSFRTFTFTDKFIIQRVSASEVYLYVIHVNHNVAVGDTIIISNAPNIGFVPSTAINGSFKVILINDYKNGGAVTDPNLVACVQTLTGLVDVSNIDFYKVRLPLFTPLYDPLAPPFPIPPLPPSGYLCTASAGVVANVTEPDEFQMFFDRNDTMGVPLGFRKVGLSGSFTDFATIIRNTTPYEYETEIPEFAMTTIVNNNLNLIGDPYFLMSCPQLRDALLNITPVKDVFAKILLIRKPSNVKDLDRLPNRVFNTYVHAPRIFEQPISRMASLEFFFYNPDNTLYDFRGLNHSFTLEIDELVTQFDSLNISSRIGVLGSYIQDATAFDLIRNNINDPILNSGHVKKEEREEVVI